MGTSLIHTRAYSPESKGKIERSFRTIKDNWLNGTDWNEFISLNQMNIEFDKYLCEKYTNNIHSAINMTPRDRYIKDFDKLKFIPCEILDDCFLHRDSRKVSNDSTIQLQNKLFEVPQKYIGQRINIRYLPTDTSKLYIYDKENKVTDTIYSLKRVDNSKVKRNTIDYTKINGGDNND